MLDVHIGPIPPPLGGISVYLYRLLKNDETADYIEEKDFLSKTFIIKWSFLQFFSRVKKNFISHSLNQNLNLYLYILTLFCIHNFSLVIHGPQFMWYYQKSSKVVKYLNRKMFSKAKTIQVINTEYMKFIENLHINNKNIIVKNAFLPPPLEEEVKILKKYKKPLIEFLNSKTPIIVANAFAIDFVNDIDLYGLDMCVELTSRLKKDFPNIGFLFALADDTQNNFYVKEMIETIKKLDIQDNFYLMTEQQELWPIFKRADLMIRPTYIDGYGISIEEALFFNCTAIASDVCQRPVGTILCKNRDSNDFYNKCKEIFKKKMNSN